MQTKKNCYFSLMVLLKAKPEVWHQKSDLMGACWMLLTTLFISLFLASGKLVEEDISIFQVVFLRYVTGFLTVVCLVVSHSGISIRKAFKTTRLLMNLARSVVCVVGITCLLYAAMGMPLADVNAIGLTQNMFIVLLAVLFLRESISLLRWVSIICCAAGAFLIALSQPESINSFFQLNFFAVIALVGALLIAIEMILVKLMAIHERSLTMLLYVNGLGVVVLCLPAIANWQTVTIWELVCFSLLGPIAIAAQLCTVQAYRLADASFLAPINYCGILFGGIIGFFCFGEIPSVSGVIGALLITIGGVTLVRAASRGMKRVNKECVINTDLK
ncbi:DMT family transporter [Zooshikella marina]|uniref:DMT family transporter n=1 Tax=Zooshikella ganghwensis TaxID=202772 RepID=UPI001BB05F5E|nr:DMT family transporter [Zooshikella ganghwensis]MBU2707135.1 DMT family transporter [Zooshikella ganghwensis]